MAKTKMAFDIGSNSIKIVTASGTRIKLYEIRIPDKMMKDGEIAMPNAFSEFLKKEMKKLKLRKGKCSLVLPSNQVICRLVTLPKMTKEQLALNLPYEFSEFIHDDPDKFFCDYAMCEEDEVKEESLEILEDGTGEEKKEDQKEIEQMTLMAAVASKERLSQYIRMFSDAGLKLEVLLPSEMSLIQIVKNYCANHPDSTDEFCFVNLGHSSVGITIIKKDQVRASRQLEFGCSQLDLVIADQMITDPFLAGSYKMMNYQDVLDTAECMEVYQKIAMEILRVIHFYRFKYRDNQVQGLYLMGGGASIPQLCQRIAVLLEEDMPELSLLSVKDLLPNCELNHEESTKGLLAIGMTLA